MTFVIGRIDTRIYNSILASSFMILDNSPRFL